MNTVLTDCAQPLFYFFLRKTGRPADAEDLTSDVLTACIAAQKAGTPIAHPHAWVWQVARNRYAAWAKHQARREVPMAPEDAELAELASETDLVAAAVHADELATLRRELAFIRRAHREIIVAHYIHGEPIRDIAAHLELPIGTVKARLSRCRTKIREGMDMAREFGPRSYNPENMDFVTSGCQPSELPNSVMMRRLPVNILLEASENPSTIEELAMALGVAAPYMEDEVRILLDATLLKRVGERYVTDFYIMPRETSIVLRRTLREEVPAHTAAVTAIAADVLPLLRRISSDVAHWSDSDLLWWLLPWVHETALFREPRYISDLPERACGPNETWGIVGFETLNDPTMELCFMSRGARSHVGGLSGIYSYEHECEAMWWRIGELGPQPAQLLLSLLHGERCLSGLNAAERSIWQQVEGRYAHEADGRAVMDIIVLTDAGKQALNEAIMAHPAYPKLAQAVTAIFDRLTSILRLRMSETLLPQLEYVASNELLNLRMMVLNDCLHDGLLTLPKTPEKSTIGIWLELR